MKFDNVAWLLRRPQKSSFLLRSFLLVWCRISNTIKVLGYKKKAKVFFIPFLSKLNQISANLRWKFSCHVYPTGKAASVRREIRTRREILKKKSDFSFCCAGHVASRNQTLLGILSTLITYRTPKSCFSRQVTGRNYFALYFNLFFPLENRAFEYTISLATARSLNTTKITDLQEKQTFHLPL